MSNTSDHLQNGCLPSVTQVKGLPARDTGKCASEQARFLAKSAG